MREYVLNVYTEPEHRFEETHEMRLLMDVDDGRLGAPESMVCGGVRGASQN